MLWRDHKRESQRPLQVGVEAGNDACDEWNDTSTPDFVYSDFYLFIHLLSSFFPYPRGMIKGRNKTRILPAHQRSSKDDTRLKKGSKEEGNEDNRTERLKRR